MNVIDRLLGRGKPTTAAAIRAEITSAEAALENARAVLEKAHNTYQNSLLEADATTTTDAKTAIVQAEVGVDRAEALIAALRERFLEACELEAENERLATYAAAKEAHAAAVARLRQYPALAAEIAAIIADVARAELVVREANRDLPAGVEQIAPVERSVRGAPPMPEKILKKELQDCGWH